MKNRISDALNRELSSVRVSDALRERILRRTRTQKRSVRAFALAAAAAMVMIGLLFIPRGGVRVGATDTVLSSGGGTRVWISEEDALYHARSGCGGTENLTQTNLAEAKAAGRKPCPRCIVQNRALPTACPEEEFVAETGIEETELYWCETGTNRRYYHADDHCVEGNLILQGRRTAENQGLKPCETCIVSKTVETVLKAEVSSGGGYARIILGTEEEWHPEDERMFERWTAEWGFGSNLILPGGEGEALLVEAVPTEGMDFFAARYNAQEKTDELFLKINEENEQIFDLIVPAVVYQEEDYELREGSYVCAIEPTDSETSWLLRVHPCAERNGCEAELRIPVIPNTSMVCQTRYVSGIRTTSIQLDGYCYLLAEEAVDLTSFVYVNGIEAKGFSGYGYYSDAKPQCFTTEEEIMRAQIDIDVWWMTDGGVHYHRARNCSGMRGAWTCTAEAAEKLGKPRCPTCGRDDLVWTAYGKYYHLDRDCGDLVDALQISETEAEAAGLMRCPVCMNDDNAAQFLREEDGNASAYCR